MLVRVILAFAFTTCFAGATEPRPEDCPPKSSELKALQQKAEKILGALLGNPNTIFANLPEAIAAKAAVKAPVKMLKVDGKDISNFPSYSSCPRPFFRVATIPKEVDASIEKLGWKSGWDRREAELKKSGQPSKSWTYDALPASEPFDERIIQYVRVAGKHSPFPKHSTVVGVLEDPIRTLSVGYHTGYDAGIGGSHMRMDEIEVGECAEAPACKKLKAVNTTEVFTSRDLIPRFSTEGEWAVDGSIPKECIVATYRIQFQKVDEKCYSDVNGNCSF